MPLQQKPDGQLILKCMNHDSVIAHTATGLESTMTKAEQWNVLTTVTPPPTVVFKPDTGLPVRCYVCGVCGYVELYSGSITEPLVWRSQK